MNVLVINGSPKGELSNTKKLTDALLEGVAENKENRIKQLTVKDMDITPCLGCMSCWGKTSGKCVIDDVMTGVYQDVMAADLVIESFPLYFFGMPGPMKTFTDRMMPLMETYKGESMVIGDNAFHEPRFDMSGKKLILVSTCGYARTEEIYDSLIKEYNFICGKGNYMSLFCPQGEMFSIKPLEQQIKTYLQRYREIGRLLGRGEKIPDELLKRASDPILPHKAFKTLVNNYWNSYR